MPRSKLFKVFLFKVEQISEGDDNSSEGKLPLKEIIDSIFSEGLNASLRSIGTKRHRLEGHRKKGRLYLLNFATLDYNGPGRATETESTRPFQLGSEAHFSHQTAMLYDPDNELAFIESNRAGISSGIVSQYFTEWSAKPFRYKFIPFLDDRASALARNSEIIRRIVARYYVGEVTEHDDDAGTALVEQFSKDFGARYIDISVTVGPSRGSSLNPRRAQSFLTGCLAAVGTGKISKLRATVKESEVEKLQTIDLLEHQKSWQRDLTIDRTTRWIDLEDKWAALQEMHSNHLNS